MLLFHFAGIYCAPNFLKPKIVFKVLLILPNDMSKVFTRSLAVNQHASKLISYIFYLVSIIYSIYFYLLLIHFLDVLSVNHLQYLLNSAIQLYIVGGESEESSYTFNNRARICWGLHLPEIRIQLLHDTYFFHIKKKHCNMPTLNSCKYKTELKFHLFIRK